VRMRPTWRRLFARLQFLAHFSCGGPNIVQDGAGHTFTTNFDLDGKVLSVTQNGNPVVGPTALAAPQTASRHQWWTTCPAWSRISATTGQPIRAPVSPFPSPEDIDFASNGPVSKVTDYGIGARGIDSMFVTQSCGTAANYPLYDSPRQYDFDIVQARQRGLCLFSVAHV
jgi:hypothetical protein